MIPIPDSFFRASFHHTTNADVRPRVPDFQVPNRQFRKESNPRDDCFASKCKFDNGNSLVRQADNTDK
jgi:hypothetical protein